MKVLKEIWEKKVPEEILVLLEKQVLKVLKVQKVVKDPEVKQVLLALSVIKVKEDHPDLLATQEVPEIKGTRETKEMMVHLVQREKG